MSINSKRQKFWGNCFGTTNGLQTQLTLRWVILVSIFIVVIARSRPSIIAVQNQFLYFFECIIAITEASKLIIMLMGSYNLALRKNLFSISIGDDCRAFELP